MGEESDNPVSCWSKWNRHGSLVGKLFATYPALLLIGTLCLAITATWVGISTNGFPEFGDPYLGFQTRFTSISNRLVTLENFRQDLNRLNILENYPGERISEKESRRRRRFTDYSNTRNTMCSNFPLDEYGRLALELRGNATDILSKETLSLICYFQELIEGLPFYGDMCESDEEKQCCPMWSISNYIAIWSNQSSCLENRAEEVSAFTNEIHRCHKLYLDPQLNEDCLFRRSKCPQRCHHGGIFHSAQYYTMEQDSLSKNITTYAMIILPIPKTIRDRNQVEAFQNRLWELRSSIPPEMGTLAGFDLGGRDSLFESYLLSDLQYVGLASVIIFLIVVTFTQSLFLTVISFGMLILSIGITFFLYKSAFSIPYFPFMNMLVTIIVMGIGTDATLIVSSAWKRSKFNARRIVKLSSNGIQSRSQAIMTQTLNETTATLVMTMCTTAAAFFASLTSSITTIRCFSIFAGTAIIVSFILLYISVPLTLDLSDRIWATFKSLASSHESQSKFVQKFIFVRKQIEELFSNFQSLMKLKRQPSLSTSKILWTFSFAVCLCILIWAVLVVFLFPGFALPSSEQFQLLSASHPVEVYNRLVQPSFNRDGEDDNRITIYLIWGLRPVDNGNPLDPQNYGTLEFDPNFSLIRPQNQKWMRKLCRRIKKFKYYDQFSNAEVGMNLDSCFMDTLISWMKRDCFQSPEKTHRPCCNVSKFPYDAKTLHQCIGLAARDVYRTPSIYFQPDIAGPKFFANTSTNPHSGENLATFTVRIRTNVSYSLSYTKMNNFYNQLEKEFDHLMKAAPAGLDKGFFISSHFEFYDLQKSLIGETWTSVLLSVFLCFVFLWISSRNFHVAIGAVITILAIVLVTAALLIKYFDWKLGVFESISVTVAVGLSDFTAHHSLEFSKEKALTKMTLPTFFSAVSTVVMGLSIFLLSNIQVYEQIGSFFFILIITSWIYSVFFLSPVLKVLDILGQKCRLHFFKNCCDTTPTEITNDPMKDQNSHSDLIVDNRETPKASDKKPGRAKILERKHSFSMEKWWQLKKSAQETSV